MSDEATINDVPFLKDPRDYALLAIGGLFAAVAGAWWLNENSMGDKPALFCDQIRAEYAQAAETIPTLLPEGSTRDASISLVVTMKADEIGAILPWIERPCPIL